MKRRHALKGITASVSALIALPTWATNWTANSIKSTTDLLDANQESILAEITATLIPEGEIPGAKSLGVPAFVQRMVSDCYDKNVQENFKLGLNTLDSLSKKAHNQSFIEISIPQKTALLQQIKAEQSAFYTIVRSLTIQGYSSSEYVMKTHLKYVMAPGHYYGCAKI
jgi:Gluconate 2-dehydrogenase subunit 3